jgi:hypothetical protein
MRREVFDMKSDLDEAAVSRLHTPQSPLVTGDRVIAVDIALG